ncbi:MAG: aromatic ring-hydroxylating dioxygenase subunit alpha [Pseudomonadota bacterium]
MQDDALFADIKSVLNEPADATGLGNRSYTDAALFRYERDAVVGKSWSAVCFTSDLPQVGFAHPVQFMGLPLLVVRDRDDELRVFHNVCRHRGMTLVENPMSLRQLIRCPYHSWAYDLHGQLKSTPHIGGSDQHQCEGFDPTEISLKSVRSATWLGMVFVNLSGDGESFDRFIEPLLSRWNALIAPEQYANLKPAPGGSRRDLIVQCNWKLPVENYCEAYHLPWVHPDLNRYSPLSEHFNIMVEQSMSGQGSRNYEPAKVAGEQLPVIPSWPQDRLQHAEYISLYPNVLLGIQADHAVTMILVPVNEQQTVERFQLSFAASGATDDRYEACREAVIQRWNIVFGEDVFAVEGMQKGRLSPGFDGGLFTPVQDLPTHHFHQWVARKYLAGIESPD